MNSINEFEGKWLNIRTGQYAIVSNVLNDELGNMIFITNQGNIPGDVFSQDYIKDDGNADDVDNNIISQNISSPQIIQDPILVENNNDINNIYYDNIISEEDKLKNNKDTALVSKKQIIDKIFKKITTTPKILLKIDWPELPINDIKTIVNYLEDITIDDISNYIIDKYLSKDDISKVLSNKFEKYDNVKN